MTCRHCSLGEAPPLDPGFTPRKNESIPWSPGPLGWPPRVSHAGASGPGRSGWASGTGHDPGAQRLPHRRVRTRGRGAWATTHPRHGISQPGVRICAIPRSGRRIRGDGRAGLPASIGCVIAPQRVEGDTSEGPHLLEKAGFADDEARVLARPNDSGSDSLERVHEEPGAQLRLESSRGRSHALHRSARSVKLLISLERGIRLDRTRRTMWHPTSTPGLLVDCGQSCRALSPPPAPSSSSGRVPSSPSGR